MFISKQEAEERVNSSRNAFSKSFSRERTTPSFDPHTDVRPTSEPFENRDGKDEREEDCRDSKDTVQSRPAQLDSSGVKLDNLDLLMKHAKDPYRQVGPIRDVDTQVAIGTVATIVGSRAAGGMYDKSEDQARVYSNGFGSTHEYDGKNGPRRKHNEERMEKLQNVKNQIADLASSRLVDTLNCLTTDKIQAEKSAGNIARIGKDLAVVVDKVTREKTQEGTVHFHLWRPEIKPVSDYPMVRVSAPIDVLPAEPSSKT